MSNELLLLASAYDYAARMHAGQRRKGVAAEPYINHPCEVAGLLARATGGADPVLIAAGVLHDTIEDTPATRGDLTELFGGEVAALVMEVTDDKSLAKEERKRLQIAHAASISPRGRLLKIADKTSNLWSLADSPPDGWPRQRRDEYLAWSEAVVANCRGDNQWLDGKFDAAVARLRDAPAN